VNRAPAARGGVLTLRGTPLLKPPELYVGLLAYPLCGGINHWATYPPLQPAPDHQEDNEQYHQREQHHQDG
jgi:hypothetical protein